MRHAGLVLCCITPKYIQSDNCLTDLRLAENLGKPIIPLLLRFSAWPPEGAPPAIKKTLAKCTDTVELYNDKLYRQNLPLVIDRVRKVLSNHGNSRDVTLPPLPKNGLTRGLTLA